MYQTHKTVVLTGLSLAALAAVRPASADPFLSVPPASFLNYHVATVSELSQEVALDPLVRARLARHFHRSEAEMTAYIRENLTLTRLSKAGVYRVACVTPRGREYSITERLKAGTPVFASIHTGKPILKLACGNPLVATLPPAPPKPVVKVKRAPAILAPTTPLEKPAPEAPPAVPTFTFTTPTLTPSLVAAVPAEAAPLTQVADVQEVLTPKGGGFSFLPVAAVAGVAALWPKGGGSSPQAPPAPPAPPPAVPEPSPLLLLGLGGAALAAWRLRTRRA